jgi:serine/threonine-protein kinase
VSATQARLAASLADRYTIERELGHGGMATVYLAHDVRHDRDVALKVLRPELAAVLGRERFLAEIRLTAKLDHPHILTLHDSGESDGFLWYALPYIRGESLRQKLERERQLGLEEALAITRDIAGALDHAHRHGIIHRDVKPENILLHEGEAMLADFGIALAVREAGGERLTETGLSVGTPQYMSPEQATAERQLDARSDIYSLGCVLYEMLAGEPPFTGATGQAVIAKLMTERPTRLRTIRDTVPQSVDDAVGRALGKVPADRYASAADFAQALEVSGKPVASPSRVASWVFGSKPLAWGMALLATGFAVFLWTRRTPAPQLDPDLIAIAPFDVLDPKLQLWREGMVDILARSLDGAGSLRTAAPTVVIKRWTGRADAASARTLGQRTGAALVVYGSLLAAEGDSIRANVSLLDARSGRALGEIERRGAAAGIDRLADSIAIGVLTELGRSRSVGAFRGSGLGGRSVPALKAFLQGEQFLRVAQFDSALAAYKRAIALDSVFPQALRGATLSIGYSKNPWDSLYLVYAMRAGRSNHGLGLRDSLLTQLDSTNWAVEANPVVSWANRRRATATAKELVRLYPEDPEAWFQYGETLTHNGVGPGLQASDRERLAAFDRAIALDSGFAPAYEHAIGLALDLDGPARSLVYVEAFRRAMRREPPAPGVLLMQAMLRGDRQTFDRVVDSASPPELMWAGTELGNWPDSAELDIAMWRSAEHGRHGQYPLDDSAYTALWPRLLLLYRGHARQACADTAGIGSRSWFIAWCGALEGLPPDSTGRLLEWRFRVAPGDPDPTAGWQVAYRELPWRAAQRDTMRLARLESWMESSLRKNPRLPNSFHTSYILAAAGAYRALARGDSTKALELFRALPDSLCPPLFSFPVAEVLAQAQLELAQRQPHQALKTLEYRNVYEIGLPPFVGMALTRAIAAEQAGDRELALRSYQFVVDVWRHADPALQPYVQQARDGLARLTAEPRR